MVGSCVERSKTSVYRFFVACQLLRMTNIKSMPIAPLRTGFYESMQTKTKHDVIICSLFISRLAQTSSDYSSTSSTSSKSTQKAFDSTLGLSKTFIEQHIPRPTRGKKSQFGGGERELKTKKPCCQKTAPTSEHKKE